MGNDSSDMGQIKGRVANAAAAYSVGQHDHSIVCDSTAGAFAVTLPPLSDAYDGNGHGRIIRVLLDVDGGDVTVEEATADGGSTLATLDDAGDSVELQAVSATAWKRIHPAADVGDGSITTAKLAADAVDGTKLADDAVDSEHYTDGSIDNVHLADDAVDSAEIADGAIDPVHLATTRYRAVAEDGALALGATDYFMELTSSASGAKAATKTATHQGHEVTVLLFARSGGSYTLACNQYGSSGTVTLDAAGEGARLIYSGSAWELVELLGTATFA